MTTSGLTGSWKRRRRPMADDRLTAKLAVIGEVLEAAAAGPYKVDERHGRDIADEGWSEVRVTGPDGKPLAATFITNVLEPDGADDVTGFLVAAREHMPRLLAAVEAVLKLATPPADISRDLDGNPEGPVVHMVESGSIRWVITRALLGEDDSSREKQLRAAADRVASGDVTACVIPESGGQEDA